MLRRVTQRPLCNTCSKQLLDLFATGFTAPSTIAVSRKYKARKLPSLRRSYHTSQALRTDDRIRQAAATSAENEQSSSQRDEGVEQEKDQGQDREPENEAYVDITTATGETRVQLARQIFGDSLPEGFLSSEEYTIYERLYGPPTAITQLEDEQLPRPLEDDLADVEEEDQTERHALFKETEDGLEEVDLGKEEEPLNEDVDLSELLTQQKGETAEAFEQRKTLYEAVAKASEGMGSMDERTAMLQDLQYADELARQEVQDKEMRKSGQQPQREEEAPPEGYEFYDLEAEDDVDGEFMRTHPLTLEGHSGVFPTTVRLPIIDFVEPVQRRLAATARYEHLTESANDLFGGHGLPHSNATPSTRGSPQQQHPSKLNAHMHSMSRMEANLFLATIMPGAYAVASSIIVEVHKRLGADWLRSVLQRPGGPRVLDAGAGGAGVLAWREILSAEWDVMHENTLSRGSVPLGTSTVVAGSDHLREAASGLLSETSFIPRLPDFKRARDLPAERDEELPKRKQYDIVIAPYTLYGIEEDYIRKSQLQNLWSLVDPDGGVLIIFEKGIPRGFEIVAEARDTLLKHHIRNPDPSKNRQEEPLIGNFHTHLEDGMIIAPCTTHNTCPMYQFKGEAVGRRDFCRFKQRYERPPFLQRIRGAKYHNHEDVSYSYLAVQRGRDLRKEQGFAQNEESTTEAFEGFEGCGPEEVAMHSLPRIVSPPLKRTGHVTMDVCTPQGTLERWTTPKSFSSQGYRDARKSKWGDLWALGAKTRVETPAKAGKPKDEAKTKVNFETGEMMTEGMTDEQEAKKKENAKRKAVRMRKAKLTRQPKYANDTRKKVKAGTKEEELDELD